MPFYRHFGKIPDQDGVWEPDVGRGFLYDRCTQSNLFVTDFLYGPDGAVYKMLRELGATTLRVWYDGGSDSDFARADSALIYGNLTTLDDVIKLLSTPENVAKVRAAAELMGDGYWHDAAGFWKKRDSTAVINRALSELAREIATQLLGKGFGTGDFSMYGAVNVDLVTGKMTDDPDAQLPDSF